MNLNVWIMLVGIILLISSSCILRSDATESNITRKVRTTVRRLIDRVASEAYPRVSELVTSTNITTKCLSSALRFYRAIKNDETWAFRMIMSSGIVPTRLIRIGMSELGDYDRCVNTQERGSKQFQGQYCSVYVTPPKKLVIDVDARLDADGFYDGAVKMSDIPYDAESIIRYAFRLGVCVPSTCTQQDISSVYNHLLEEIEMKVSVENCRVKEDTVSLLLLVIVVIFLCSVGLVLAGTFYDFYLDKTLLLKDGDRLKDFLQPLSYFSARKNLDHLMSPIHARNEDKAFIGGAKVFLSFWIILGHSYLAVDPFLMSGLMDARDLLDDWFFGIASAGYFAVTAFFFLSGFFLMTTWQAQEKSFKSVSKFFVYMMVVNKRYLRIMVPAAMVVLYSMAVPLILHGEGTDGLFRAVTGGCWQNWYKVILGTSNYDPMNKMCNYHMWYLSADLQIFCVALFPVMFILRYPKTILFILGTASLSTSVGIGVQTLIGNYSFYMTPGADYAAFVRACENIYFKPQTHASAVFLGVIFGYISRNVDVKLSKLFCGACWCISGVLVCLNVFLPLHFNTQKHNPEVVKFLYSSFSRFTWALSFGWFVYALLNRTHFTANIRRFLSHQTFVVLGRLTYGIYLVHWPIMTYRLGARRLPVQYENFFMFGDAISTFVLSVALSVILYLTVEAPFARIERSVFSFSKAKPLKDENINNNSAKL